jgi:hypothetical protein
MSTEDIFKGGSLMIFKSLRFKTKFPMLINSTWLKMFFCSHMLGWTVAWIQTVWIVYVIKKMNK